MSNNKSKLERVRDRLKEVFPNETICSTITTVNDIKEYYYHMVVKYLTNDVEINEHSYRGVMCEYDEISKEWLDCETNKPYDKDTTCDTNPDSITLKLLRLAVVVRSINVRKLVTYLINLNHGCTQEELNNKILNFSYWDKGDITDKDYEMARDALMAKYRHIFTGSSTVVLLILDNKKYTSPLAKVIAGTVSSYDTVVRNDSIVGYYDKIYDVTKIPTRLNVTLNKDNIFNYSCNWIKTQRALLK